jgi:putative protease
MAKKRKAKAARKKVIRKVKKVKKVRVKAKAKAKAKALKSLGIVDHYFDHISVAAIKVKAPFKVGDIVRIKGHTTDFVQKIDSMQIEHQAVAKVKKGDDVGIKVKEKVRQHDAVYPAKEKELSAQPAKSAAQQQPMFRELGPSVKPAASKALPASGSAPVKKAASYSETRFLKF